MALTNKQLEQRQQGITATDIAKICGVSPYGGAIDVVLDKRGEGVPFVETDRVKWGNLLEGPIRDDYAQRHGVTIDTPGTLSHPKIPWALATPDGVSYPFMLQNIHVQGTVETSTPPVSGLEIKTHASWLSHHYGAPGTDEVPAWEITQCAWNLYVARAYYDADITRWDLTAFIDGVPTDYVILRDPELEEVLVEKAKTFWQKHIIEGIPLEPDGSDSYGDYLNRRFPKNDQRMIEATPEISQVLSVLRETRSERKELEQKEARLVQRIKEAIGDAMGIINPTGTGVPERITWKKNKDSTKIDWKAAYQELLNTIELNASVADDPAFGQLLGVAHQAIQDHTKTKPGARPFNVPRSWGK